MLHLVPFTHLSLARLTLEVHDENTLWNFHSSYDDYVNYSF